MPGAIRASPVLAERARRIIRILKLRAVLVRCAQWGQPKRPLQGSYPVLASHAAPLKRIDGLQSESEPLPLLTPFVQAAVPALLDFRPRHASGSVAPA
jgi:hypothetical protein